MDLLKFFKNSDIQKTLKDMTQPLGQILYERLYIYIWLICIYNVLLIFMVLVIFVMVIRHELRLVAAR